jgi:hypothetical protein
MLIPIFLTSLLIMGCAGSIKPISNGSQRSLPDPNTAMVVWGDHAGAVGQASLLLQQYGFRVLERARLNQVFNEQSIRLTHTSDDDAQILKVGKLVGAESIVFISTTTTSSQTSAAFVNQYGGGSRSETVTNVSVSARGVDVQSGEVMWTGVAHYPQAINNPEAGILYLTDHAIGRGLCPAEAWIDSRCDYAKVFGSGMIGFEYQVKGSSEGSYLVVTGVKPGLPAEKAGLLPGDVLVSCNGRSGFQTKMQYKTMCKREPGESTNIGVKRGDKLISISAIAVSKQEKK